MIFDFNLPTVRIRGRSLAARVTVELSDGNRLLSNGEQPVRVTGKVGATTFEGVDVIRVIK